MPLLGPAAMLLSFDIAPEAIQEHDDWHTHEHLPERLSIPGFLRGTRWVAVRGTPRYLVLYEVSDLEILTSPAYLERLNNPSAWTRKMMPHYRGMSRGLCSVAGSFGLGVGGVTRVLRFKPQPSSADSLVSWLVRDAMPSLPATPGIGSVHLLQSAAPPPMTNEQRIRGADSGVDAALLLSGYREDVPLPELLRAGELERRGAVGVTDAMFRMDYSLARADLVSHVWLQNGTVALR